MLHGNVIYILNYVYDELGVAHNTLGLHKSRYTHFHTFNI